MALMFAIWSPQPNWIPRKPKLIFQICQKLRSGFLMDICAGSSRCSAESARLYVSWTGAAGCDVMSGRELTAGKHTSREAEDATCLFARLRGTVPLGSEGLLGRLVVTDVEGAHAYVDLEGACAGTWVDFGDREVTVGATGAVVVEGAEAYVDFQVGVALVLIEEELHMTHADVELSMARAAGGVEVEVSVAEVDLIVGVLSHRHGNGYRRLRSLGEVELDDALAGLDADGLDVVGYRVAA